MKLAIRGRRARFLGQISAFVFCFLLISNTGFAKEHIVKVITDIKTLKLSFEPNVVFIKKGDTVTWVNEFNEDHNMMTYPDGFPGGAKGFISPFLGKKGDRWSHTFNDPGTFKYHCLPHIMLGMRGIVVVDQETKLGKFHKPTTTELKRYRDAMLEFFDPEDIDNMPKYVRERLVKK